jgi:PAS domain S-box-containing protein
VAEFPLDILCFASISIILLIAADVSSLKKATRLLRYGVWVMGLLLIALAYMTAERAENQERMRLQQMLEGFPPTYAAELQRLRHDLIKEDTKADDPRYLEMIELQKNWLKLNPAIIDIYTIRRTPQGKVVLVVDSETDYDHNNQYNNDREKRTPIYEIYNESHQELLDCLTYGYPTFTKKPYTDKWGTWISAYAPLNGNDNQMDGVIGINFAAGEWNSAIARARWGALSYVSAISITMLAAGLLSQLGLTRQQQLAAERESAMDKVAKTKFESLVNSIQGVVWERDVRTFGFTFVSSQCDQVLNRSQQQMLASHKEWLECVHEEDRAALTRQLRQVRSELGNYRIDYRVLEPDGSVRWVRETGTCTGETEDSSAALRGVIADITARKQALLELETTQRQLVDASRKAGMAEVASGVLHNVGNVLNSINVSSSLIHDTIKQSKVHSLERVADLLSQQKEQLGYFITSDPRGRGVPDFLHQLSDHLNSEHTMLVTEVEGLLRSVEHIKDIIVMQQNYARVAGRLEPLSLRGVVEDALEVTNRSFYRHSIKVECEFEEVPNVLADRHKLLQILINLIRNAKHAMEDCEAEERVLKLQVCMQSADIVLLRVIDNGIGIPAENLTRIFNHGFTTKDQGHGFGLHSSAIAAREMGGQLTVSSEGKGMGATFTLEIPAQTATSNQPPPTDPALVA